MWDSDVAGWGCRLVERYEIYNSTPKGLIIMPLGIVGLLRLVSKFEAAVEGLYWLALNRLGVTYRFIDVVINILSLSSMVRTGSSDKWCTGPGEKAVTSYGAWCDGLLVRGVEVICLRPMGYLMNEQF